MDSGGEIAEGFLCPICMSDLRSPAQLSSHFEQVHAEDRAVLNQLRSAFGKAKKKIFGKEEDTPNTSSSGVSVENVRQVSRGTPATGGIDVTLWEQQGLGVCRSSVSEFRTIRKAKVERYVVEINKILIRLEKLLKSGVYSSDSSLPNVIKAKKDMEKSVVPWESDSGAKYCRYCSKKFGMLNRKHHCRLCGLVMCGNDSGFVSPVKACDVLNLEASLYTCPEKPAGTSSEEDDKNDIRVCISCAELLNRYEKLSKEKNTNTVIVQLYERLKMEMHTADSVYPAFVQMADSINLGEVEYRLEDAVEKRLKLLKHFETMDVISKKIQFFGSDGEKPLPVGIQKLQKSIRMYAASFLQDRMFTMPGLPTEDVFADMRRKRELELARQKQERKEKLMQERLQNSSPSYAKNDQGPVHKAPSMQTGSRSPRSPRKGEDDPELSRTGSLRGKFWKKEPKSLFSAVSISKNSQTSWGPVQVTVSSSPEPMVQQMEIIRNYIAQAKQEKRYEEVELFEQNLKELEMAYMEERRAK